MPVRAHEKGAQLEDFLSTSPPVSGEAIQKRRQSQSNWSILPVALPEFCERLGRKLMSYGDVAFLLVSYVQMKQFVSHVPLQRIGLRTGLQVHRVIKEVIYWQTQLRESVPVNILW